LGLHWQFGVVQNAVSASASGGFAIANVTDSGQDTAPYTNPPADGDVMSITNNASGHSTCTFKFYTDYGGGSQTQLTLGTISDQDFAGRVYTEIIAWEGNSAIGSGSDIAESSNEVTDLVGTWYFKITSRLSSGSYSSGETITIVQLVDGSITTTGTFDVE
tara:strand:+ start:153 stop:635 length:483 start_codon:yes stop_codon:yes gene_type:complete